MPGSEITFGVITAAVEAFAFFGFFVNHIPAAFGTFNARFGNVRRGIFTFRES